MSFETTTLWKNSLAPQAGAKPHEAARKKLRDTFLQFRERAATLAGEIPTDLSSLTVHDITHLDALWETASLIAGQSFSLTPTEAFVLGGAFLVHDLAMSRAAYPEGLEALRKEPASQDMLIALLRKKLGRSPSKDEISNPDQDAQEQLTKDLLRINHARQAEQLPVARWEAGKGAQSYHLIEDPELRETYGPIIGRIAHSHWWSVDRLSHEFKEPLGAPGGYPANWEVDALKLASLLRVADASHLDDRRAPGFLRALRKPEGIAEAHWQFQSNLFQPRREPDSDRLIYTTKRPFTLEEAAAWWVCFDTLQMVDRELRQVDALLADLNRPRLAVRGVAKVDTPERLSELIRTQDWLPVDVRIKVSDVAGLARHIGGEQLYGDDKAVPLRELIQNASDAVRARRLMEGRASNWGDIYIRFGKDSDGYWIEVEDTGVGMSVNVLTGPLLDFGTSYWGSELMLHELPGLLSKEFQPTGQYGIGFFSVFMWGDRVHITTRRYQDAQQNTNVLEFGSGLISRPILRKAREAEFSIDGGTRIRIWFREPSDELRDFLSIASIGETQSRNFKDFCVWLCPAVDANLYVEYEHEGAERIVAASDWLTLEGDELLERIGVRYVIDDKAAAREVKALVSNVRPLKGPNGEVVGRACIYSQWTAKLNASSVITVGGLRGGRINGIVGLLIGSPTRATRDTAIPVVEGEELKRWATEQASLATNIFKKKERLAEQAAIVRGCRGELGSLPVALGARGWLTIEDIANWHEAPDEVFLNEIYAGASSFKLVLNENVLLVNSEGGQPTIMGNASYRSPYVDWPETNVVYENEEIILEDNTLIMAVIEALAKLWSTSLDDVIKASDLSYPIRKIGVRGKKHIESYGIIIRKPQRAD